MPITKSAFADKILTDRPRARSVDIQTWLTTAARMRGVSPVRIALEIIRRRLGRQKLHYQDYFLLGLHRPELSDDDRNAFVSESEASRLNSALAAPERHSYTGIASSKLLTELLLRGAGLPTSTTVAVARAGRVALPVKVLVGADEIDAFLRTDATFPLFGKPEDSSFGIGAASLIKREADAIVLGDGTRTSLRKLAEEIARDYPGGYLFQNLLKPHPEIARLLGPAVGTLRVLTLRLEEGPVPIYAMLKLPGPGAMVDGALSGANGAASVDLTTGAIRRAQLLSDPPGQDMVDGHVTGARLPGAVLPDFKAALELAQSVHRLFLHQGVIGSDVILSDNGPLLNEINFNPLAALVQKAMGHGLFTDAIKAKYRAALEVHGKTGPIRGVRL